MSNVTPTAKTTKTTYQKTFSHHILAWTSSSLLQKTWKTSPEFIKAHSHAFSPNLESQKALPRAGISRQATRTRNCSETTRTRTAPSRHEKRFRTKIFERNPTKDGSYTDIAIAELIVIDDEVDATVVNSSLDNDYITDMFGDPIEENAVTIKHSRNTDLIYLN